MQKNEDIKSKCFTSNASKYFCLSMKNCTRSNAGTMFSFCCCHLFLVIEAQSSFQSQTQKKECECLWMAHSPQLMMHDVGVAFVGTCVNVRSLTHTVIGVKSHPQAQWYNIEALNQLLLTMITCRGHQNTWFRLTQTHLNILLQQKY